MDPSRSGDRSEIEAQALARSAATESANPQAAADAGSSANQPSTAWDNALGAALHDVPVPAGLSSRLLARLSEPDAAVAPGADLPPAAVAPGRRRWLRAAAVSLACAASVAAAIIYFNQPSPELSAESVVELVRAWHNHQPGPAENLRRDAPPADYAPGDFVRPARVVGWSRLLAPLLGREGVAYELAGPRQNRATLYVLDLDGPRTAPKLWLNASSPLENPLTTDGQTIAAWTDGLRLYVLVANGDEQDFRTLVRAPSSMA